MELEIVKVSEYPELSKVAELIWRKSYSGILSTHQIDHMLEVIYSPKSLEKQVEEGQKLYFVKSGNVRIGFIGVSHVGNRLKLDKLYLLPKQHGSGIGKQMLEKVFEIAKFEKLEAVYLHVNRYNPAVLFYLKQGFRIECCRDYAFSTAYWMNDYVLEKRL